MLSTQAPVFSIAWRQDRARAVRYLSHAHLGWSRRDFRPRLRRLFPHADIDWTLLDPTPRAAARPWPVAQDPHAFDRLPAAIEQLRRWADLPDAPLPDAAIALAAARVLTDWIRADPRAAVLRPRLQPHRF